MKSCINAPSFQNRNVYDNQRGEIQYVLGFYLSESRIVFEADLDALFSFQIHIMSLDELNRHQE